MMIDTTDDRLRQVSASQPWEWCWRCRMPYSYEDLIYSGIDVHGQWRWECRFCREEAQHGRLSAVDRIRARTLARQRLFAVLHLDTAAKMPKGDTYYGARQP